MKFYKTCGIMAMTLFSAGLVLLIAGSLLCKPHDVIETVDIVTNGRVSIDRLEIRINPWGYESIWSIFGKESHNSEQEMKAAKEIKSGNIDRCEIACGDVSELIMKVGGCHIEMKQSKDDHFYIEAKMADQLQAYEENGIIYLMTENEGKILNSSEIVFYLPDDQSFERVQIDVGAGKVELDSLESKEMVIRLGAGEINAKEINSNLFEAKIGAGRLKVKKLKTDDAQVDVAAGNLEIKGSIDRNLCADCASGNIYMKLDNDETDFDYEVKCAGGNIQLGSNRITGTAKRSYENGADQKMELNCSRGNIEVHF